MLSKKKTYFFCNYIVETIIITYIIILSIECKCSIFSTISTTFRNMLVSSKYKKSKKNWKKKRMVFHPKNFVWIFGIFSKKKFWMLSRWIILFVCWKTRFFVWKSFFCENAFWIFCVFVVFFSLFFCFFRVNLFWVVFVLVSYAESEEQRLKESEKEFLKGWMTWCVVNGGDFYS